MLVLCALCVTGCERHERNAAAADAAAIHVYCEPLFADLFHELVRLHSASHPQAQFVFRHTTDEFLFREIESGEPVDLFVTGALDLMSSMGNAPDEIEPWIENRLVLIRPKGSTKQLKELAEHAGQLAIVPDEAAPLGSYTRLALRMAGLWEELERLTTPRISAEAVLEDVARGAVAFGVVYATDAAAAADRVDVERVLQLPASIELTYHIGVYTPAGAGFARWLRGPQAAETIRSYGFTPLGENAERAE